MGGDHPSTLTLRPTLSAVAGAREFVRRALGGAVPPRVSRDLQLIASELFTNAVKHGDNERIAIAVHRDAAFAGVTVDSRGHAPNVGATAGWAVAAPTSPYGRGLGIVRKLADEVIVDRTGGHLVVTARRALDRHEDA